MTKLKLDLDTLAVQSFKTAAAANDRGTVVGREEPSNINFTACTCPAFCHWTVVEVPAQAG
jgi:hypothetical protein